MEILDSAATKQHWKRVVKTQVHEHWQKQLEETASSMSTLNYLNTSPSFLDAHHSISIINNVSMSKRANVKLHLMTGTYTLQAVRAHVYNQVLSPVCLLCKKDEETLEHFLLLCPELQQERDRHLPNITSYIPYIYRDRDILTGENRQLLHLIIDPSHPCIKNIVPLQQEIINELEVLSQNFVHTFHTKRLQLHKLLEC